VVGPDGGGVCGGVRVGLGVGTAGVLMGLVVGGCGYAGGIEPVGVAVGGSGDLVAPMVGGSGVPAGTWIDVADGSDVGVGGDGVLGLSEGVGVRRRPEPEPVVGAGGVCVPESCVPAGDIGVHVAAACDKVAVACNVAGGGSTGGKPLFPPILLPATTVPITHIRLPATSAPIVRMASRGNERSRLIWLLLGYLLTYRLPARLQQPSRRKWFQCASLSTNGRSLTIS
jgi:hypothetical protein